jgi:hypothetical protein
MKKEQSDKSKKLSHRVNSLFSLKKVNVISKNENKLKSEMQDMKSLGYEGF